MRLGVWRLAPPSEEKPRLLPQDKMETIVALLGRYHPVAVYAFGSRVAGEERADSDLDLAVLLLAGSHLPVDEKLGIAHKLEEVAGCDVDLVVLNDARLPVRFEIIRHGRVLWEASQGERTDAEEIIVRDYLDFRPFLQRSFRDMLDGAREGSGRTTRGNTHR